MTLPHHAFLRRSVAGLALTLLLAVPAFADAAKIGWVDAANDVPADPAVRFGQLPNGMRYAILKNATPAAQAAMRLRIGSGSLQESEEQQGLAHFLEHMAFKGSTHVPAGEMIHILERKGLAFGPDTNASTDFGQTIYQLDLPQVDEDTLDTGLLLLRETGSELTLDPKSFETERGVILSEERLRDTPELRSYRAFVDLMADGQRITQRRPIGKVDVIRNAPVSLVADYYRSYYRPDNATLVVVGDFDPAAMEAKIKARFSDWKAAAPTPPPVDLGTLRPRGLTAKVNEIPGTATQILVTFARPYDTSPDSVAKRRKERIEALGPLVLTRRLGRMARDPNPPFTTGAVYYYNLEKSTNATVIGVEFAPEDWQKALTAALVEQRRLVQFGVSQDELDREIVELRAALQSAASSAATRRTVDLAVSLVDLADRGKAVTTPEADLALFDADVKDLKADTVNQTLGRVFGGAGPLVQYITAKAPEGGEAALRTAIDKADAMPVSAPRAEASVAWPYTSFGTPGTVAERKEIADLGLTTVRFANNVRLIVKPTKFSDGEVMVGAYVGNGRLALPLDTLSAKWASDGFLAGGLKAINPEDMDKALAAVVGSVKFEVGDRAFELTGTTRPSDLLAQLQILAAYASDPGFRPEGFPQAKAASLAKLPQLEGTADNVLTRDLPAILRSNDPRWRVPTREQIEATAPDALQKLLGPALAAGPLDVVVVGDVKAEDAIKLVAQTFGALPKRDLTPPAAAALVVHFPQVEAEPILRTHKGRADQAIALAAWPTIDFLANSARARAVFLACDILQNRVREAIRVAEGATYSPVGTVDQSTTFPGFGFAYSYVETPPAKVESFFDHVEKIVEDIKAHGVTEDELVRAKRPEIEAMKKEMVANTYWMTLLASAAAEPRILDLIRSRIAQYEQVTPTDIQAVVTEFLAGRKPLRVIVLPEDRSKS